MTNPARESLILSPRHVGWLFAAVLLWSTYPARAEYRLQAGDVVEVSVAGAPELRHRAPVQLDGTIMLPLVGTLMVEGAPFSEIRSKIQTAVASKAFRVRTSDGRDLPRMFEREEVSATIVDYKPVFVAGDVSRAGEQAFRPRMSVRQALASAGGLLTQPRTSTAWSDVPNVWSDYVAAWLALVKEHARVWRIRTELGEKVLFDRSTLPSAPVPDTTVAQIHDLEIQYRASRDSDHDRAKAHVERAVVLADKHIAVLSEQQQKEEQGALADTEELNRVKELFGRGNLTITRVTDARRAVLLSSTRQLQTAAQLMSVRKSREEFVRELEKIEDQRRIRLLAELQEANVKLAGERAKLQSTEEKLRLLGARPAQMVESASVFDISVFRRGVNGTARLEANPDTELQPGDVVEVALRSTRIEVAGP